MIKIIMKGVHGQTAKIIYRSSPDGKLFTIKKIKLRKLFNNTVQY